MREVVERVALAAQERAASMHSHFDRHVAEEIARAAIEAMREPTAAMLEQGPGDPYMDADVWARMIDEALK